MKNISLSGVTLVSLFLSIIGVENVYAIPSFARQTGLDCTVCHTVFPELTHFGRDFKMRGYVMGGGDTKMPLPLAAMIMADATTISKSKNPDGTNAVVNGNGENRNGELVIPQVSLFYGGKIYDNVGAFIQMTYDGTLLPQDKAVAPYISMDNVDIRYANSATVLTKELVYGVSVNNNPTVQDLWNSTPAWGFPYVTSSMAPTPSAATLIDGGLGHVVAGASIYAMFNDLVYAELGAYQTIPAGGPKSILGWHNGGSDPVVDGASPYGRIALQQEAGDHYIMVGTYAMATNVSRVGSNKLDSYHDMAVDAEYQYTHDMHNVTATASKTWEEAKLDASHEMGASDNTSDSLSTTKVKAGYRYDHKYGASLGYALTSGKVDATRYGTSGTLAPDSSYGIAELDYLPINQVKFTMQYIMYDKFNGAKTNYDGAGRNASDNNTLYLVGWFMF
ncbi:MAG: hypothetical protein NTW78_00440 [Campylobacterales bacterium]|nr:hypothetical protein [Campylobacterales bacterium]